MYVLRSVINKLIFLQESLEDMLKSFQGETKEVLHSLFPHINVETAKVFGVSVVSLFHFPVLFFRSTYIILFWKHAYTWSQSLCMCITVQKSRVSKLFHLQMILWKSCNMMIVI